MYGEKETREKYEVKDKKDWRQTLMEGGGYLLYGFGSLGVRYFGAPLKEMPAKIPPSTRSWLDVHFTF